MMRKKLVFFTENEKLGQRATFHKIWCNNYIGL